jgi:ABC-type Mn2+/Zn2+ transport system permease subunit
MTFLADMFAYEFNQRALLAAVMIGFMNGYIGGYVVLRRGALFAGSLSHTLFPGVALGALIAGLNPYSALIGAFVTAMVIGLGSQGIAANSRIDRDAALAVLFTAASAAGLLILQRAVTNVRIEEYLFGNILGISNWDIGFMFAAGGIVLSALILLQRPLQVFIFSPEMAATQGIRVQVLDYLLAAVVVITMVTSLQAVGALLALGLLVAPAATLYLYVDSPPVILWGGGVIGVVLSVASVIVSNVANIQTGPVLVILLGIFFMLGFMASPRYGLLAVLRSRYVPTHE